MPVILLVDIDCFFAQAEQIKRPELRGRPVIVGGHVTDRSVVAASSYEARARGIKTGMPIAQAARLCPEATLLRVDFTFYAGLSAKMYEVCLQHSPLVEMVSLDEGFLDLTGCERRYISLLARHFPAVSAALTPETLPLAWPFLAACLLQQDILNRTGLRVTIGVATNRSVAKIASDVAKPGGILSVWPGYEAALLAPLPVKALLGVGPRTAERLGQCNFHTVADLAALPAEQLVQAFGLAGSYLHDAAHGRGPVELTLVREHPKSIGRSTTFHRDTCDRRYMAAMLSHLLQQACCQLRGEVLQAATVTLTLRYADFETVGMSHTIANATDHDDVFYGVLLELLPRLYKRRVAIRMVGVTLSSITPSGRQLELFDEEQYRRRSRLYQSMDAVRERFGFSSLVASRAVDLLDT